MAIGRSAAWFSALLICAILMLAASALAPMGGVESQARDLVTPLVTAVQGVLRPISNVVLHAGQVRALSEENAALRLDLERLQAELGTFREQRSAVAAAAALLGTTSFEANELLVAQVLLRDPAPGQSTLLVARGSEDGVIEGQPVLGAGGTVVGIVADVEATRSWVRLLTHSDSSVAVVVQSSRVPGALQGGGGTLTLEFVERGANVAVGDVFVTSALGGRLPPGLLAGRVASVDSQPQHLHARITVEPLSDLRRLEQVLIVTGFMPGLDIDITDGLQ
jgi:rod shape-determining protein MreC